MRAVSAELRTFATELSSLKAEMNNHLRKNTNTRLLLFGITLRISQILKIVNS